MALSSEPCRETLAVVMAGGNGSRLGGLTRWHAKPALPFGGQYRNIDFPLSNCVNSGIRRIGLLTQYKAHSLIQHVLQGWSFLRPDMGEFIELWPAQQRSGERWYEGTADAVYQNIDIINGHGAAYVLVLAGDHVYKMDYVPMIEAHIESRADVTVGCVEVPVSDASAFGVMEIDTDGRVRRFDEKPASPAPTPYNSKVCLASMGIYVFGRAFLARSLSADANSPSSNRDFGHDLLPSLIESARVYAYPFRDPVSGAQAYWRDVGTVDSYWQAHMELLVERPRLNLYDPAWPIWTHQPQYPPPRFGGNAAATQSIVSAGCLVWGTIHRSLLSTACEVGRGSEVTDTVVLPNVRIGRDCRIRRAIIDSGTVLPDGAVIGEDLFGDQTLFHVSRGGVVLVADTDDEEGQRKLDPSGQVAA
jgi:glucose-1-phosphate adenylyltransferase